MCDKQVDRSEVIKGYEFDEGQYVLMEAGEMKKIAAASSKSLEILAFTKMSEIDPIFYDASYFVLPDEQGRRLTICWRRRWSIRGRWGSGS